VASRTLVCRASPKTQAATDGEHAARRVYRAFDLLHLGGWDISGLGLVERKALLEPLVGGKRGLQHNGHDTGDDELILKHAGKLGFEGVVSKTIDAPYAPGNRGLWRKAKAHRTASSPMPATWEQECRSRCLPDLLCR
jgi:ATP-dependent DNA ligase